MLLILSKTESVGELQHNSWGGGDCVGVPYPNSGGRLPCPLVIHAHECYLLNVSLGSSIALYSQLAASGESLS